MSEPIKTEDAQGFNFIPWAVAGFVSLLAILSWGQDYGWSLLPFDSYRTFPLLGLLAFSIMWSHYFSGTLWKLLKLEDTQLRPYFRTTGWAVLVLICLHPGLLIYQRFRDGYGLPPGSYKTYVAPSMAWLTLLGTVCLLVFLAFELKRFFGKRTWWHFIAEAGDFAMLGIFYHGLKLGSQLHGWYRTVWWFYGITLVCILLYSYWHTYGQKLLRRTH